MRLFRIEIVGFKSFAEKTTITFQPGVTAIVGPNGTGKSNIIDALLWVLGEARADSLRGDRMEDIIFSGSEGKKPVGMAEVSLTLSECTGRLPPPFSEHDEVTVTRRYFRSEESEYFINKVPCRLKDIRYLLLDTGAGSRGHTAVEQGKVEEILHASPDRRRRFVEEVAGIAKFRAQRQEAEGKLALAQQNILQLQTIIAEVKKQKNLLERQKHRAEQYRTLEEEIRRIELMLAAQEGRELTSSLEEGLKRERELREAKSRCSSSLTEQEVALEQAREDLQRRGAEVAHLREETLRKENQIQTLHQKRTLLGDQVTEWEALKRRFLKEKEDVKKELAACEAEQAHLSEEKEAVERKQRETEEALSGQEARLREVEEEIQRLSGECSRKRERIITNVAEMTEQKNRRSTFHSRTQEISRRGGRREEEREKCEGEITRLKKTLTEEEERGQMLFREITAFEQKRALLRQRAEGLEEERGRIEEQIRMAQEDLTLKKTSLSILQGVMEEKRGALPLTLSGLCGVVADFIEVLSPYEKAIEAVLGERLQGLVFGRHEEIREAITLIKQGGGRATLLPLSPRRHKGDKPSAQKGIPALQGIKARPGYEKVCEYLLEGAFIVRDLEEAIEIWEQEGWEGTLVTVDGDVIDPGGVISAGGSSLKTLKTRKEIRELTAQVGERSEEVARVEEERGKIVVQITELTRTEKEREETLGGLRAEKEGLERKREELARALREWESRQETLALEEKEREAEQREIEEALSSLSLSIETGEKKIEETEAALSHLQGALTESEKEKGSLYLAITQLKVTAASLKEKRGHIGEGLERIGQIREALLKKQHPREEEYGELERKIEMGMREIEEITASLVLLAEDKVTLERRREEEERNQKTGQEMIKRSEETLLSLRRESEALAEEIRKVDGRITELRLKRQHLEEEVERRYHLSLDQAVSEAGGRSCDPREAYTRLEELRRKAEAIGPVDPASIEEYRGVEERYRTLTAQEEDLMQSISSLRQAITKINQQAKKIFVETFRVLNEKFSEVFCSLFDGGEAKLVLLDEDHPLESGVEILASPPGKRLKSLSLLSGGEKALTAIALVFSSFLIHPSPFYILDEIDAPLDEENIKRFINFVTQIADRSQVILITHNKRTMERADVLYGVTLAENGVSTLVSVKLTDPALLS